MEIIQRVVACTFQDKGPVLVRVTDFPQEVFQAIESAKVLIHQPQENFIFGINGYVHPGAGDIHLQCTRWCDTLLIFFHVSSPGCQLSYEDLGLFTGILSCVIFLLNVFPGYPGREAWMETSYVLR